MKSRSDEGIVFCPKCGMKFDIRSDLDSDAFPTSSRKGGPMYAEQETSSLKVIETDKGPSVLPTTTMDCTKCGITLLTGGCFRQDQQTRQLLSFIDVLNVIILGEIILKDTLREYRSTKINN